MQHAKRAGVGPAAARMSAMAAMAARSSAMAAAIAAAVAVAAAGCGGGHAAAGGPLAARAPTLPPLLAMVPADAGAVIDLAPGLVELLPAAAAKDAYKGLAEDRDDEKAKGHRLAAAFLGQLVAGDGAITRTLGWRPGQSEAVAWARGRTLVIRARVDGAALEANLERAEVESGERLERRTWHERTYVVLPDDDGRVVLARAGGDEAVFVWTGDPDHDVALLMDDQPAARPFDTARVVSKVFPGRTDGHFGMMVDPSWFIELAGDDLAKDLGADCQRAVADLLHELPPLEAAWARTDTETEIAAALQLAPGTVAKLARGLAPIPRWPVSSRYATLGFGLSAAAAIDVVTPWMGELDRIGRPCGQGFDVSAALRMVSSLPLVTQLERGVALMDPRTEAFALAMKPTDIASYWAALRTIMPPLRPQPPAVGERLEMPQLLVTSDGESLFATQGHEEDEPLLADLRAAKPGPAAIFAMVMSDEVLASGDDADDEGLKQLLKWVSGMAFEVGVRDQYLTARVVFRHR
ncbi:MAG TPA: hypothetical protein VHE35_23040 [Kofleriaceae bacterium]|nr:hypothetical protein [Kofleriaceae bacterium]